MLTHPSKCALHEIQEYPELTALAPGFPATRPGLPPIRWRPPEMRSAPESGLGCGLPLGPRAVTGLSAWEGARSGNFFFFFLSSR